MVPQPELPKDEMVFTLAAYTTRRHIYLPDMTHVTKNGSGRATTTTRLLGAPEGAGQIID